MNNSNIGQYDLIIKDLINLKNNKSNLMTNEYTNNQKIKESESNNMTDKNIIPNDYNNKIMKKYLEWINKIRHNFINIMNETSLYYFFIFDPKTQNLINIKDYWDMPITDKLFSFSLFISDCDNLTYLIGLVYNYAIIIKHFNNYKMRIYIDFHSVFGSAETFNLFNMFLDILEDIDPTFNNNIQMIVFFLNPYYEVNNESIYTPIIYDIKEVIEYYNNIFYYTSLNYIASPLLNFKLKENKETNENKENKENKEKKENKENKEKKNISINIEDLEINYKNIGVTTSISTFVMFATHIAVNLRFLPLNEDCEYHVRDLDCRLSITDINIINKFNNPKYQYVPYYVFQFYKFYFPYLKWRIDVNPYLAGCFGGSNKKPVMISKELEESDNLKILKKEIFLKYILFISFNAANLQIGFLNDEFILANIFEKIKGNYSENILFLNLGSYANKHVNEYYYGINNSSNYPCILKLGVPLNILTYPLNGKYLTIDPITDFKIGLLQLKYHNLIKKLITEQLKIYLNYNIKENIKLANIIRSNYLGRLKDEIKDDLEAALFFSMIPITYKLNNFEESDSLKYTSDSYANQHFSSIGDSKNIINNEKLKATNIMICGYLLSDVLEDIIFPSNPQYINSNYYLSSDNYDRLFNCLYFDELKNKFIQKKITKKDISRKYIDQNIISHIPKKLLEFENNEMVINNLNDEFNLYLSTCQYYSSLYWYINKISFNNFINVDGKQIRSGILLFVKNYTNPLYDKNDNIIYSIEENSIKNLKYKLDSSNNVIKGINISKNKLKYNILFIDDNYINQFNYSNLNNQENIKINLLKTTHINKLSKILNLNKYNDFLIIDNL